MVITYMQRKVHSRNKSNDKYTQVNSSMINIIYTTTFTNIDIFQPWKEQQKETSDWNRRSGNEAGPEPGRQD